MLDLVSLKFKISMCAYGAHIYSYIIKPKPGHMSLESKYIIFSTKITPILSCLPSAPSVMSQSQIYQHLQICTMEYNGCKLKTLFSYSRHG
jgi:hypothetical protein